MRPALLLRALRDGEEPAPRDLAAFAHGIANGEVSDPQAAAFAMAVCLRGLSEAGRIALTEAMRDGGARMAWDRGPVLDKHSTGGVGDCVSLVLAPALAACGALVPMVSGRGLGHTGGTLDKLEAIPGLRTDLDTASFRRQVEEVGCAIVAAGPDLAPADRRLYALRDVTGTVRSVDLIVASILSKKLAAGLGGLVLDVKAGSGALARSDEEAGALARALVDTASGSGCPTLALVTDMDEPVAPALGNALEVREAVATLRGAPGRLADLTVALGAEALVLGGLEADLGAASRRMAGVLEDGRAAEAFAGMVAAQGGRGDPLEAAELPQAPVRRAVEADDAGVVAAVDGRALGEAVVDLGAGRRAPTDAVDPSVGLSDVAPIGRPVERGDALAVVHAATGDAADAAVAAVRGAFRLGEEAPARAPLVRRRVVCQG